MKDKFWKIVKAFAFTVIIFCSLKAIGEFYSPRSGEYNQVKAFEALPENSVDVLAYGSSRCWKGFDAAYFQDKFGVSAYNYGNNWQHINTTWLFFKNSLLTQSPKVVLIEVGRFTAFLDYEGMDGELLYCSYLPESDAKYDYFRNCFGDNLDAYVSYYFPIVAYHGQWKNTLELFEKKDNLNDYMVSRGYNPSDEVVVVDRIGKTEDKIISERNFELIEDIINTCKEQNIEIVFWSAPSIRKHYDYSELKKLIDENGCYFIDFYSLYEEIGIDLETDFRDKYHLNDAGSKKVVDYIGNFMIEQGIMP